MPQTTQTQQIPKLHARAAFVPSTINHGGKIVVDHAHQFDGDLDANRLFSSRALAYAAMVEVVGEGAEWHYIVEVPY